MIKSDQYKHDKYKHDKYFSWSKLSGQIICRLAEEQTLSLNIVKTEQLELKMMKDSKTCHFANSDDFG